MKRRFGAVLLLGTTLLAQSGGERIYLQQCASCHERYHPVESLSENFMEANNTLLNLKAPTMNQLAFRIKQRVGDPNGDREFHLMEVVAFIKDYIYYPDLQKSVCMDEVLRHFDTMPSLLGKIGEADLEAVAEWIYFSDNKEEK